MPGNTVSALLAHKRTDYLGTFLTIAMPALVAVEPYLRSGIDAKLPPAAAAVVIAAFGGILTVASRIERKRAAEDAQ